MKAPPKAAEAPAPLDMDFAMFDLPAAPKRPRRTVQIGMEHFDVRSRLAWAYGKGSKK